MSIELPPIILSKPPLGEPCNGCGVCCSQEACKLSVDYLNSSVAPCIALEWSGERFECGLIKRPSHYLGMKFNGDEILRPLITEALGIGRGCDADDESES